MNKSDLIARVAAEAGLSKREAGDAVEVALRTIKSEVAKGERVTLPGFGTFERRERAARTARNPHTGEPVKIPATRVPSFRAGAEFKETVKGPRSKKVARKARR